MLRAKLPAQTGSFKASTKFDALKTYSGVFKNTPE